MAEARFTLTLPGRSLAACQELADRIEADVALDPLAVAITETDEAGGLWDVVAYFADEAEAGAAARHLAIAGARLAPLPAQNWVRQSLEGLAPVAAGRFYLHGSHDRARRRAGGISLEIDAGTAFGTGHHGTTEGCLLALDAIAKRARPQRILDVGCGTGVLAIAAARSLHRHVLATDIDPEAVRVTGLNAAANGAGALVQAIIATGLKDPRITAAQPFDLVFANILARPLIHLAHGLARALAPGGHLVLSGLTRDQVRWVLAAYRNRGLVPVVRLARGNWATLVLARPPMKKRPQRERYGRFSAGATGPGWEDA
jgi:ribosomal protein L11 methyltransferase